MNETIERLLKATPRSSAAAGTVTPTGGGAGGGGTPGDGGTAGGTSSGAGGSDATSAAQDGADHRWVFLSLAVVVVGWLLAIASGPVTPVALAKDVGVFGLLYVMAQAIERLLEPIVSLDPFKIIFERIRNLAGAAARADPRDQLKAAVAAVAQADVKRWKANRAVVVWALATVIGTWASARIGIRLLDILIDTPAGGTGPDAAIDIAVTGLVVGGGTKPLHDLISRVQASSTTADAKASTAATSAS